MVEWIISNKEWIFSGLGIAIISAFFAILKTKTPVSYTHLTLPTIA